MSVSDSPVARQLSPSLYVIEDICNVYIVRVGERALLIDAGLGLAAEAIDGLGIRQVEWVLHTHFHRDQCAGTERLRALGARTAAPRAELGYFEAAENFWRNRTIFDNYNTYNDFFAPTASIPIDRPLDDYATFAWQGIELLALPAPGHTKGGVALVGTIDGRRVAFTGDVIHQIGQPVDALRPGVVLWTANRRAGAQPHAAGVGRPGSRRGAAVARRAVGAR